MWQPAFRPNDVESERQVILEEIGMRDDTPDDLVHELFEQAMFPRIRSAARCSARDGTIKAMPRDAIAAYHAAHYHPSNIVFAAAGNLDARATCSRVAELRTPPGTDASSRPRSPALARDRSPRRREPADGTGPRRGRHARAARTRPDRYAFTV